MSDRLSSLDVSFLYLEQPETAMHVGAVMIFEAEPGRFDPIGVEQHIAARIARMPRYRQRVRTVPGRLAKPVWVDDEHFDLSYHVRRSALPHPGGMPQLTELVARLQARPLDQHRPLWELTIVEGLAGGRFALITKVHQALVDGISTVDLGQILLDDRPGPLDAPSQAWTPAPGPSPAELLRSAVIDSARRPVELVEAARAGAREVFNGAQSLTRSAGLVSGRAYRAIRSVTDPAAPSPLKQPVSQHRRFAALETDLADYRQVRARLTGQVSVNDVMLAALTGALRTWLLTRGESVVVDSAIRTLVPVSVRAEPGEQLGTIGGRVASLLVDLPTGEPSPLIRVQQIAYQTKPHRDAGRAIDASALAGIAGFAPPTLHALGARVAAGLSRRLFHLVVTNVPGPQHPLFVAGSRMLASYPVMPMHAGQVLAVGVTSYDGAVYWSLNADRDGMTDLDLVVGYLRDSLSELVEAAQ